MGTVNVATASLNTTTTSSTGANVQILDNTTTIINDKFNIGTTGNDNPNWSLLINLNETWGFVSTHQSRLTMRLFGDTIPVNTTSSAILLSITDGMKSKYISMIISLATNASPYHFNFISPACDLDIDTATTKFMKGDVLSLMANTTISQRICRVASCPYSIMGLPSNATSWPLVFTIENFHRSKKTTATFEGRGSGYSPTSCAFNDTFGNTQGTKIFLSSWGIDHFAISQIDLRYDVIVPTKPPTKSPTKFPTIEPTFDPTSVPTSPTSEPTTEPTSDPLADPTDKSTGNPSSNPSSNPITIAPSMSPTTSEPSIDAIIRMTTSAPTEFQAAGSDNNGFMDNTLIIVIIAAVGGLVLGGIIVFLCMKYCGKKSNKSNKNTISKTNGEMEIHRVYSHENQDTTDQLVKEDDVEINSNGSHGAPMDTRKLDLNENQDEVDNDNEEMYVLQDENAVVTPRDATKGNENDFQKHMGNQDMYKKNNDDIITPNGETGEVALPNGHTGTEGE